MNPINEWETIQLFRITSEHKRHGWKIIHEQRKCPDTIIENEHGITLRAEFEFESKNFIAHGHDPKDCDLIICWKHNWKFPAVPVWDLSSCELLSEYDLLTLGDVAIDHRMNQFRAKISSLKLQLDAAKAESLMLRGQSGSARLWILCLMGHTSRYCYMSEPDKFEEKYLEMCKVVSEYGELPMLNALQRRCKEMECQLKPNLCGILKGLGQ